MTPTLKTSANSAAAPASSTGSSREVLRNRWQALAARERQLVLAAAALVSAAVLWWLLLAPALRTLREAPARHAELDAQHEKMQALASEARLLQADAGARPTQAQAQRALEAATKTLGSSARTSFAGDRATVVLQGAPAAALAPWLAQVRGNARSLPVEAHLTRSKAVPAAPPALATPSTPFGFRPSGIPGLPGTVPAAPPIDASLAVPIASVPTASEARWDGRIVLALPAR